VPKSDATRQARRHGGLAPGAPGYRTRPGRSGFDPVDTYAEEGRMIGLGLRGLLRMRVRSWPAIVVQGLAGVGCVYVAWLLAVSLGFAAIVYALLPGLMGLALITNAASNASERASRGRPPGSTARAGRAGRRRP